MLNLDGAFAPASKRGNGLFYKTQVFPPKRFVAAQLSAGMKMLYKHLGNKKKSHHQGHVAGSQTNDNGKFQPCYPVPLLAGRYKFVRIIGQGQSAVLVAAEDTFHPDKRPVAVKVMNLDYANLGAQEAEFLQQLNRADVLKVSRTVQLFNTFSFDSHYCLVFELLRPRPLHQYFQKCQFENEETKLKVIRKIALQLLQVLGFLKRENVIHADLKPENILIEEGDEIKIKVIDFGNAIRYVHKEVSLYYDEFELQTIVYRAPEVMFGVPFGYEIDMWSVGCILAELHIGKPLFLGRTKPEILQVVTSVLGPLPRSPFQSGKFFQDLSEFVCQNPEANQLNLVTNMMKNVLHSINFAFASFLVGLLQYNPGERLSPCQAAMHAFIAPDFPLSYLLPQHGDKITDDASGYTSILLTPDQYTSKPDIEEQIKRQQFSGTELLRRGTKVIFNDVNIVHQMSSSITKQKRDNNKKSRPPGTVLIAGNKRASNTMTTEESDNATEGPFATSKDAPTHKWHKGTGKDDRYSEANILIKKDDQMLSNVANISPRRNGMTISYNDLQRSTLKEKRSKAFGSKDGVIPYEWHKHKITSEALSEGVCEQNSVAAVSNEKPEIAERVCGSWLNRKLGFDTQMCSSIDTPSAAARTRIYYRKSNTKTKEQDDVSLEIKQSRLGDPEYQEQLQLVHNQRKVKLKGKKKKMCRWDPVEHNSERGVSSDKYQDDVRIDSLLPILTN